MDDTQFRLTLHEASRSMDLARIAAGRSDWTTLELALRDLQERSSRLLRQMMEASAPPPKQWPQSKQLRRAETSHRDRGSQPATPRTWP
jgi:hypothetical protein